MVLPVSFDQEDGTMMRPMFVAETNSHSEAALYDASGGASRLVMVLPRDQVQYFQEMYTAEDEYLPVYSNAEWLVGYDTYPAEVANPIEMTITEILEERLASLVRRKAEVEAMIDPGWRDSNGFKLDPMSKAMKSTDVVFCDIRISEIKSMLDLLDSNWS